MELTMMYIITVLFILYCIPFCTPINGGHDILKRPNETITMTCTMQDRFQRTCEREGDPKLLFMFKNQPLPIYQQNNATTITSILTNVTEEQSGQYQCYCETADGGIKEIDTVQVYVGELPETENISCISQNFKELQCSWNIKGGKNIVVVVNASVKGKKSHGFQSWNCTTAAQINQEQCTVKNLSFMYEDIVLELEAQAGGKTYDNKKYAMKHTEIAVPGDSYKISAVAADTEALLTWVPNRRLRQSSSSFPSLVYDIRYKNPWTNEETVIPHLEVKYKGGGEWRGNVRVLRELEEYTVYNVTLRGRFSSADESNPQLWKTEFTTFKTLSSVPDVPKVPPGFFQSLHFNDNGTRNVVLFWQNLQPRQWNGPEHKYRALLGNNEHETSKTSLEFKDMKTEELKFQLVAQNKNGSSEETTILVPAVSNLLPAPKAKREYLGSGVFRISWERQDRNDIISYTIAWCKNLNTSAINCDGSFDWTEVDGSSISDNISREDLNFPNIDIDDVPFAIAANSASSSSGLVWIEEQEAEVAYLDIIPIVVGILIGALILMLLMAIFLKRKELENLWKPPTAQIPTALMKKSSGEKSNYQMKTDNVVPTKEVYWNGMLNGSIFGARDSQKIGTNLEKFQDVHFQLLPDEPSSSLHDTDSTAAVCSLNEENIALNSMKQADDGKRNPSGNSNDSKAANYVFLGVSAPNNAPTSPARNSYLHMNHLNAFDNNEYVVADPQVINRYQNIDHVADIPTTDTGYIPPEKAAQAQLKYITPDVNYTESPVISPSGYVTEEQANNVKPIAVEEPSGYITEEQANPMSPYSKLAMSPQDTFIDVLDQPISLPSASPNPYSNQTAGINLQVPKEEEDFQQLDQLGKTEGSSGYVTIGEATQGLSRQYHVTPPSRTETAGEDCSQDTKDSLGYVTHEDASTLAAAPTHVPANAPPSVPKTETANGSDYVTQEQAIGLSNC